MPGGSGEKNSQWGKEPWNKGTKLTPEQKLARRLGMLKKGTTSPEPRVPSIYEIAIKIHQNGEKPRESYARARAILGMSTEIDEPSFKRFIAYAQSKGVNINVD